MSFLKKPARDAFSDNDKVAAHFSLTPALTRVPLASRNIDGSITTYSLIVRDEVEDIYFKHRLTRTGTFGLYWLGPPRSLINSTDPKTVVFVIELRTHDLHRWSTIDSEVRNIFYKYDFQTKFGACIRYYERARGACMPGDWYASPPGLIAEDGSITPLLGHPDHIAYVPSRALKHASPDCTATTATTDYDASAGTSPLSSGWHVLSDSASANGRSGPGSDSQQVTASSPSTTDSWARLTPKSMDEIQEL